MNQPGEPDAARRPPPPLPSVPGVEDLEPIGRGGYSVVYRGRQPELGRDVAVKVITAPGTVDPAADWWRREMTAMGRLSNHPNIVTAYASGMTGEGSPYLLLPYVPGGSLQDRLRREGPLSPDEAVSLGAKLASALSAAHAAGVLHRDVKPDNVLLSPYGEPQLTDFGIARLRDATTTAVGLVHATVAYAAPEVLAGEPATEVADVYGLAATLHTCLAGTPPFRSQEEDTLVALLARIATQPPPDLRALGVPSELAAVIEGGLAKDPGGRIGSADELRRLLEAAGQAPASVGDRRSPLALDPQEDEPPTSVVPVAPERASPPALPGRLRPHRRPRRETVMAAVLLGAVLAVAGALLARGDDDPSGLGGGGSATPGPQPSETAPEAPATGPPATGAPATLAATATRYFEALGAGDLDAGYDMLSPAFQEAQSRASYVGFWSSAGSVEVLGQPFVDLDAGTATVPVLIAGRREDYPLMFVTGVDGTWLVDGPRPARPG